MVKLRTTLKHKKKNIKKYSSKNKRNKNKKTMNQKRYKRKRYSKKMIGGEVCLPNGECLKLVGSVKGTGNILPDVATGVIQSPVRETVQQKLPEESSWLNRFGFEKTKWKHIPGKDHFYQYSPAEVLLGVQRIKSSPIGTPSPVVTTTETPSESVTEIDQKDITRNGTNGTNKKDELIQSNNLITVNKNNMSGEEEENNTINPNLTLTQEQRPPTTTELEVKQDETNLTPEVEQDMNLNTDNNVVTDDSKNDMEKKDDSLINISSEEIFDSEQSKQPNEPPENLKKILKQEVDTLNTVNQESTPPKKVNFGKRVNEAKKDVQNEEKPINVEQNRRRLNTSKNNNEILKKFPPIVVSKDDTHYSKGNNNKLKRSKSFDDRKNPSNLEDLENIKKENTNNVAKKVAWGETPALINNIKRTKENVSDFISQPDSVKPVETEYGNSDGHNQYTFGGGKTTRRRSRKMKTKKRKSRNSRKMKNTRRKMRK